MTADAWVEANNRYLVASIAWLKLRLRYLLAGGAPVSLAVVPAAAVVTPKTPSSGFVSRVLGRGSQSAKAAPAAPPIPDAASAPRASVTAEDVRAALAARDEAARMDPPPALLLLAERFELSAFERDTLLLCAAMEWDAEVVALCARAQHDSAHQWPTFGLALELFDDPSWDALAAHRSLRYARMLEISQPGGTPLASSALRADERIVSFLIGQNVLDDRLAIVLDPVPVGTGDGLAASQDVVAQDLFARLNDSTADGPAPVWQLLGVDPNNQVAVASRVCSTLQRRLYRMAAEDLPPQAADLETLTRLWQRETVLLPVSLYVDATDVDDLPAEGRAALVRFLSRGIGLVFLGIRDAPLTLSVPSVSVTVRRPTAAEQFAAWRESLAPGIAVADRDRTAATLTGQFDLDLREIRRVAKENHAESATDAAAIGRTLWNASRDLGRQRLDALAQRLDVKATWDDLVLPGEQINLVRRIAGQVRARHTVYEEWGFSERMTRGFGISALFAGESGVGKTMAAEVIANDLGLHLYRIDLSAVLSKYIGETPKNLRKLFDAAEQGGAILFFDEADALFGKRSEVKDSHDRYANIETNYLLQRMEEFSGLAILATNMKAALDPAFLRRLRFVVNLPFPGVNERKRIWSMALPAKVPTADLDFDRLARLNISGGNIHSIALNAAFVAAQNGKTVTMPILLAAARAEMRKLDRPFNEAELR
jgi:hypothetical protein